MGFTNFTAAIKMLSIYHWAVFLLLSRALSLPDSSTVQWNVVVVVRLKVHVVIYRVLFGRLIGRLMLLIDGVIRLACNGSTLRGHDRTQDDYFLDSLSVEMSVSKNVHMRMSSDLTMIVCRNRLNLTCSTMI